MEIVGYEMAYGESELGPYAKTEYNALSTGLKQRLAMAKALLNDPEVLFLDEPTLGLDPAGQRQILGNVRRIANERGAAVLLSTHLLAEVEENCSRLLILNRGRVIAEGTVSEIARRAAAPRSGRLHVSPEHAERAVAALAGNRAVEHVRRTDGRPDWLTVVFATPGGTQDDGLLNEAVRALLEAGVPLVSFELEGARLSDAFLAMTEVA